MTKIESARQEYSDWCSAIGIDSLDKLKKVIESGKAVQLINLCEARQERKYAEAADELMWRHNECRIVMMSGPSSSGKTSSSLRIAQQARVLGLNPKSSTITSSTGTGLLVMRKESTTSRPSKLWI